ncbi:hypothetical protein BJV82DRAFT_576788 [Fennellomyces sp. T-0311]|nr:hypothetical protein BJV82DRAFT_576788 [Fennellomyces sp. T-0311]
MAATMVCDMSASDNNNNGKRRTNEYRAARNDFLNHLTTKTENVSETRDLRSSPKRDKASALSDFYRLLATQDIESIWPKYSYLYHNQYHKNLTRRNFRQLFLSTIRSRSTQRNLHRLLVLVDDMKECGMQLKNNEYDALMHWIGGRTVPNKKFHHLTEALALFDEMQQQNTVQPSLITYNTLIHIASQVSDIRMAQRLYHDMIAHDIQPDVYTYATLISGMGKMGDIDGLAQMLEQLQEINHVANNTIVWNAALSGYSANGMTDKVKSMFMEMHNALQSAHRHSQQQNDRFEAPPADTDSFRIYIEVLLSEGDRDGAVNALDDMIQHDVEPIAAVYNALFRSFMSNDSEEPIDLDDTQTDDLETVKRLYKSMLKLNITPNSDTMYTLVSALLDLGDTNLALETFVQLNKKSEDIKEVQDSDTVAALTRRRFEIDTVSPTKLEPNHELLERLGKIVK